MTQQELSYSGREYEIHLLFKEDNEIERTIFKGENRATILWTLHVTLRFDHNEILLIKRGFEIPIWLKYRDELTDKIREEGTDKTVRDMLRYFIDAMNEKAKIML